MSNNGTNGWDSAIGIEPDPVIAALQEQVACYQKLAKLAELQHEHVQQGQTEELLVVLEKRQALLNQIAQLETIIANQRPRWGDYLDSLRGDQREAAVSLMAQTRRLLEEITAADRNDALILQQRKLNLGRQIQSAQQARQVNRQYGRSAYGGTPAGGQRMEVEG